METEDCYEEAQPWGSTKYKIQDGSHISFQTTVQKVDFITNSHFGRMLFLDGVLQSTSSDEDIYHQILVKSAVMGQTKNRRVLIAGGAEGGVAREVFSQMPEVERVDMIDWDKELVEHCRTVEKMNQSAFEDSRLHLHHCDILEFLTTTPERYDTFILDLLDVNTEEETDFLWKLITKLYKVSDLLQPCKVSINIGRDFDKAEEFKNHIKNSFVVSASVPSFQEPWFFLEIFL